MWQGDSKMVNETIPTRYLVRVDHDSFFKARTANGEVLSTHVMSYARSMSYDAADEIARALQETGYGNAIVSDLRGNPVDLKTLRSMSSAGGVEEFMDIWLTSKEIESAH
jgi:hypothetical protein